MSVVPASMGGDDSRQRQRSSWRLTVLEIAFTLFNTLRVVAYLPTLWAIHTSGDSSQHSLWTWLTWLGANTTMALWLMQHEPRRINFAIAANAANALMCALGVVLIVWYRL